MRRERINAGCLERFFEDCSNRGRRRPKARFYALRGKDPLFIYPDARPRKQRVVVVEQLPFAQETDPVDDDLLELWANRKKEGLDEFREFGVDLIWVLDDEQATNVDMLKAQTRYGAVPDAGHVGESDQCLIPQCDLAVGRHAGDMRRITSATWRASSSDGRPFFSPTR